MEKGEKDKRIGKIVKKLEDKERKSVRQRKRLVKFQAELTKDAEETETEDSKVKDLAKMNLIAIKKEMISLAKQLVILHIRRRQPWKARRRNYIRPWSTWNLKRWALYWLWIAFLATIYKGIGQRIKNRIHQAKRQKEKDAKRPKFRDFTNINGKKVKRKQVEVVKHVTLRYIMDTLWIVEMWKNYFSIELCITSSEKGRGFS